MGEYRFSESLYGNDRTNSIFPPRFRTSVLARPIGEVERLSEVLEQLPCHLGEERVALELLEDHAAAASSRCDWDSVIIAYRSFLEVVRRKHEESTLPPDAWVFLNLFAVIPLCDVYHLKIRQPDEAYNVFRNVKMDLYKKNSVMLPPSLFSAISYRDHFLYRLEKDRKYCGGSVQTHEVLIAEDTIQALEFSLGKSRRDLLVGIVHACLALYLLWIHEGHAEAALYWVQLCKALLEKLKGQFRIGTPGTLQPQGTEFMSAEEFSLIECQVLYSEAICYQRMGKVSECLGIMLKLKSANNHNFSEPVFAQLWVEVSNFLLGVYRGAYVTAPRNADGDSGKKHLSEQINILEDEMREHVDYFRGVIPEEHFWTTALSEEATSSTHPDPKLRVPEKAENYKNSLQALLVNEPTLRPQSHTRTRFFTLIELGRAELAPTETATLRLDQRLSGCQLLEEAVKLAHEEADCLQTILALSELISACIFYYMCKRKYLESQSHLPGSDFVEPSELPQFSGTWLSSAKGPFASVRWNAYQPLELQLVDKLCTLQIAKQADIIYRVCDWHDDWSHALSRREFRSSYYNQQIACTMMAERCEILKRIRQEQELSDIYSTKELLKRSALLASERGRTRTLVCQLGPGYLRPESALSLKQFDLDDKVAWNIIQDGQLACGKGTVCVEYFYNVDGGNSSDSIGPVFAYVVSRGPEECRVDYRSISDFLNIKSFLDQLHSTMSDKRNYYETEITKCLEQLYELLILPVIDLLPQDPEQNLIFAPHGVLANVPFGLLRDPDKKEFLFERYIISLAPSLRVLGFCKQRYLYLKQLRLVDDTTPIVLVGDPAYSLENHRLPGAGKEMDSIADVFKQKQGRRCVGILKGLDASVKAVLDIAEEPSKSNRSQVCIHFAVHGHVTKDYPKGALELTDPPSSTSDLSAESESISVNKYSPWKKDDRGKEKIDEGITDGLGALELLNGGAATSGSKDKCSDEAGPTSTASDNGASSSGGAGGKSTNENVFCEVGSVSKRRSGDTPPGSKFLSSEDIINRHFDWRAYFVVLSACNTSRGQVLSEGVLNLPRAFMVAGIPCIVMSQWKCDDDATAMFMKKLYTQMKETGDDIASAQRKVMLHMMQSKMEIYKWGVFAVWGFPKVCLPPQFVD